MDTFGRALLQIDAQNRVSSERGQFSIHAASSLLTVLSGFAVAVLVCAVGAGCSSHMGGKAASLPEPAYVKPSHKIGSAQTYRVRWMPAAKIGLGGRADEPAWALAAVEKH